jgi:ATP phosphoribosyltransferase regulatory subunit HisZ
MLNPTEVNVAFQSVSRCINLVLKAHPGLSHQQVAEAAVKHWGERREKLEDQLTKLLKRKDQEATATLAGVNTKRDDLAKLKDIEPILNAMMDIMRAQGKPTVAAVKKAA